MTKEEIIVLADKVASGLATAQEISLYNSVCHFLLPVESNWDENLMGNKEETGELIKKAIHNKINKKPVVWMNLATIGWQRRVSAAVLILGLGISSYFIFFNKTARENDIVKTNDTLPHDVTAPKGTKAMITLADGHKVALDSIANGTLAVQGNVNVVKTADGQIIYNGNAAVVEYNTLFNPRGSKVQLLTLSDGTKVWLNSESTIHFPTAFAGNERKVAITGEAYFEVAKDATRKFIVLGNDVTTEVLGTHFNVNTYTDESSVKVTLLEGSVKVTKEALAGLLKPGQQAQVTSDIKIVSDTDIDAVMAWKNGYFHFGNTSIQGLMKQLARWYDVEILYEGKVPVRQFGGEISREANLSQVLKILNESKVKCRLDGNKLVIE